MEQTIKCVICGAPYKVYNMTVADQSACPRCVAEANRRVHEPNEDELSRQRRRQFDILETWDDP